MITCKDCGHVFIKCNTQSMGMNLHTKLGEKNKITVTPEYYQIEDAGDNPELSCLCKKMNLIFVCDYCNNVIEEKEGNIVTNRDGKKLVACNRCTKDRPKSSTIEKADIANFKFEITN